jgi:hypothetical protein
VIAARRLTALLPLLAALGACAAIGCAKATPELRLGVAEGVESADLESGSTLVVRGEGFPVGVAAEAAFVGERRSFLHGGAVTVALPARAAAHDRVEIALDARAMTELLGEGDDDARLAGTLELRFQTSGAVVTTAPIDVALRVRSFPRNARVASEKRARVRESLRAIGIEVGDGLGVVSVTPSLFRRGDVGVGDRLTALDGVPLAADDDAIPPAPIGVVRLEAVSADGDPHRASGVLGAAWFARAASLVALVVATLALARRVASKVATHAGSPRAGAWSVPPSRASVGLTAGAALAFELAARFARVRLDLPVLLVLLAIVLFGPLRRAVLLAIAFGIAAAAALVGGGVFRVDELGGGLGPAALPGLALVLVVWAQRFGGALPTRSAHASLLFLAVPLVHVFAPRVGVAPAIGRAIAATTIATLALPALQRALAPLRDTLGPWSVALSLAGSLGALAAGVALGPAPAALAASGAAGLLFVSAVLRSFTAASAR